MSAVDELEALVSEVARVFHAGQRDRMTQPEIERTYAICRSLQKVGASPDEIRRAAWAYRQRFPDLAFTLRAVYGRWSELLASPASQYREWAGDALETLSGAEIERGRAALKDARRHLRAV